MGLETSQGCWWAGAGAHRLWKEAHLPLLWAFSSTLTSQMIWRPFLKKFFLYIYRPLEIAVEGGSKGCFVFSPLAPCSHTSSSSEWSKSDPQRRWLLCSAPQGDSGESVGPPRCDQCLGGSQAALSPVGICLGLSISP